MAAGIQAAKMEEIGGDRQGGVQGEVKEAIPYFTKVWIWKGPKQKRLG